MSSHDSEDDLPDLTKGVAFDALLREGTLLGHVAGKQVLLAHVDDELFAVDARCTHYGAPLSKGLVVGDTIRCPWHHACFSLRSGEALGAPAFSPLGRWEVERYDGSVFVHRRAIKQPGADAVLGDEPRDVVIVGGGAAGFACAEMLRRRGYSGRLTLISQDAEAPYDRPNVSKDYLAGTAPDDWMPLGSGSFYSEKDIHLRLATGVTAIDLAARTVSASDGVTLNFDRLLLATGAEPVRPPIPGASQPHVFTLRSMADSRAIMARAAAARRAVVLGSGFIGLEVAAALRGRGLEVHVVSLEQRSLERIVGPQLGEFIQRLHESNGVVFHLRSSLVEISRDHVVLDNGDELAADLVVLGAGVKPRSALAEAAGLATTDGILTDEYLETDVPGVYVAGDAVRWRDVDGRSRRVEHWVVAQRQGQLVAENMLGGRKPFSAVPFFWSTHYDVTIRYVGHAAGWDEAIVEGDMEARDCAVIYRRGGMLQAVATIGRDLQSLEYERQLECSASQSGCH